MIMSTGDSKQPNDLRKRKCLHCMEIFVTLNQGFPTGGTRTPCGYEIEHQGVRSSLGHRAAYISLIEQYISQNFFGGTKNALT